jgi:cobalamin biosynthesis protein CobT
MQDRVFILREKCIRVTQILTGKGIQVTQVGVEAFVRSDSKGRPVRVNLPFVGETASDALIAAIEGFLDHEVAHILFSDFLLLHKSHNVSKKMGQMHNLVEDTLIERKMSERFPGSAHNISRTRDFFIQHFTDPELKEALAKGESDRVQGLLMVPLIRTMAGQSEFREWIKPHMPHIQAVYDELKDLEPRMQKANSTQDTYDISQEIITRMTRPKPPSSCEGEGKGEGKGKAKPSDKPSESCKGEKESDEPMGGEESATADEGKGAKGKSKGEKPKKEAKPEKEPKEDESEGAGEDDKAEPEKEEAEPKEEPKKEPKGKGEKEEKPAAGEDEGEDDGDGEDDSEPETTDGEEEGEREPAAAAGGEESDDEEDDDPEETTGSHEESDDGDEDDEEVSSGAEGGEPGDDSDMDAAPDGSPAGGAHDMTELTSRENPMKFVLEKMGEDSGFEEAMAGMITGQALDAAHNEPYLPFTKDYDDISKPSVSARQRAEYEVEIKALDERVLHMVGVMQKDLERAIQARSRVIWNPGLRRGRLNGAALSRLAVNDDRVFRRKEESTSKDIAVGLLADLSGSMGCGRKLQTAVEAAYALSQTLDRIGIKNEVLGFTTKGLPDGAEKEFAAATIKLRESGRSSGFSRVEAVYMPIFKEFNGRFDLEAKLALVGGYRGLIHTANNIDGEAVQYAAQRLAQRREKGKLLIVLSDGAPACYGDNRALSAHLKAVVKELPRKGIQVVGIGIQTTTVQQYYPKSMVISNTEELPRAVMSQLRALLLP